MKDYKDLEIVINEIDKQNPTLGEKLIYEMKTTFNIDIDWCASCDNWRIETLWNEIPTGDYGCQKCYEMAIDLAFDSVNEYVYQDIDFLNDYDK